MKSRFSEEQTVAIGADILLCDSPFSPRLRVKTEITANEGTP
jgi:hypothetical protein